MPSFRAVYNSRLLQLAILALIGLQAVLIYQKLHNIQLPSANFSATSQIAAIQPGSMHVFGQYVASMDNLPRTSLPLTLQGTDIAIGATSTALVSISGQKAKSVTKNAELMPGVTLHEVMPTRIILDDHGVLYQLPLPVPALK